MSPSKNCVYWITGISGTGKSTLAEALRTELIQQKRTVIVLDGDEVRELMGLVGFDRESRLAIAKFNARLCRFLSLQGVDVICATISLFHEVQQWSRKNIENYQEILLHAPLEMLEARDRKNIYRRAHTGELPHVWGIGLKAEYPEQPEFTFVTDGSMTIDAMVKTILPPAKKALGA
jgi:cytidine diphosphoramidate kinase